LVRIDEIALEELEKYAASKHESVGNTSEHRRVEHSFTITKNSREGILRFHDWVQYKIIFRTLFFVLTVLSLGVLSISTRNYISFCDSKGSSIISKSCYESSSKGTEGSGQGSSAEKGTDTGSSADKGSDTGSTGKP
jgi:hypothetical protein